MKLTGQQHKRFQQVLLDAFRTRSSLEQLLRHELNENLAEISEGGDLQKVVFDVITWAEAHGRLPELVKGARLENPGNQELQKLEKEFEDWWPKKYIPNEFEDLGEVVVDHATGLMWQTSGSDRRLTYNDAQKYVEKLNRQKFADYNDWRLPTIPELVSLLEEKQQSNTGLYINSVFDTPQEHARYWSADAHSSTSMRIVRFHMGDISDSGRHRQYVRAVRSSTPADKEKQEPAVEPKLQPSPLPQNTIISDSWRGPKGYTSTQRALVLTALPVEYKAVRAHLTEFREETHPQGTVYEQGKFLSANQMWEVSIAEIGQGNSTSAFEAERAIQHFTPRIILFVGVAGGIKDVKLGDVVAATKIYEYEAGKDEVRFKPRPNTGSSTYRLEQRARAEAKKGNWLHRIKELSSPEPQAFVGPIAAGAKVVASTRSATYKFIRTQYSDALAVEMEGYGFLVAVHANPGVEALVVRGISDLIKGKAKADAQGYQEIAARNASAFAFEVLANIGKLKTSHEPGQSEPTHPAQTSQQATPSTQRQTKNHEKIEPLKNGKRTLGEISEEIEAWIDAKKWLATLVQNAINKVKESKEYSDDKKQKLEQSIQRHFEWVLYCLKYGRDDIPIKGFLKEHKPSLNAYRVHREVFECIQAQLEDSHNELSHEATQVLLSFLEYIINEYP